MHWILGELVRGARITALEQRPDLHGHLTTLDNGRIFLTSLGKQTLYKESPTGNPHKKERHPDEQA